MVRRLSRVSGKLRYMSLSLHVPRPPFHVTQEYFKVWPPCSNHLHQSSIPQWWGWNISRWISQFPPLFPKLCKSKLTLLVSEEEVTHFLNPRSLPVFFRAWLLHGFWHHLICSLFSYVSFTYVEKHMLKSISTYESLCLLYSLLYLSLFLSPVCNQTVSKSLCPNCSLITFYLASALISLMTLF